jgi:hypothetical protein
MILTQFAIKTQSGAVVKGEYEGNLQSGKVIIFSHGFGVARDSRGMFTQVGDSLKDKYIIVRFDYAIVNKKEGWQKVPSYSKQAEMLRIVYEFVSKTFTPSEVNIVAHSMGCLIAGLAQLEKINKTILLAGLPTSPYLRMKEYFSKRPETDINDSATSVIMRSDGSKTYVESDFWAEMRSVKPVEMYKELADKHGICFIRALSDQVITEKNYENIKKINQLKYFEIEANHDFEGKAREKLIDIVQKILHRTHKL